MVVYKNAWQQLSYVVLRSCRVVRPVTAKVLGFFSVALLVELIQRLSQTNALEAVTYTMKEKLKTLLNSVLCPAE